GSAEVEIVPKTDKGDAHSVKIGQGRHQVLERSAPAINLPDQHGVKLATVGVGHEAVQCWSRVLRTRDSRVDILLGDLPAAAFAILSKFPELHFWILLPV